MKRFVLLFIPLILIATAEDKKPAPKTAPAAKTSAGSITVPPDATEIAPRVWRHTDKAGKTWIYRNTPFGLSKMEEIAPSPGATADVATAPAPGVPMAEVKATDRGDTVHFERKTPMGASVWDRKKSELTAQEKQWLDRTKTSPAGDKTAEK